MRTSIMLVQVESRGELVVSIADLSAKDLEKVVATIVACAIERGCDKEKIVALSRDAILSPCEQVIPPFVLTGATG